MGSLTQRLMDEAGYVTKGGRLLQHFMTARPFLCNWQITYRCNFNCSICSFWSECHSPADELTLDQVKVVADRLRPLGPLVISMAGGEPLIRKDLPDIASILSKDHFFTLITNGWLLTPELAERLYASGLQDIHVSLDYANPDKHDGMRRCKGAFDRAVKAVETLRDARPDRRHRVHLMAVLLDDNTEEIEPLIALAEKLGVSFELSLYSHRRGQKPVRMPTEPVARHLVDLKKRHPTTFVSMSDYLAAFDQAIKNQGMPECRGGQTFFNIDDRGRVARCIDTNEQPVASLLEHDLETVLARLRTQCKADPCGDCWTSCRGFGDVMVGPRGLARSLPDFVRATRPL